MHVRNMQESMHVRDVHESKNLIDMQLSMHMRDVQLSMHVRDMHGRVMQNIKDVSYLYMCGTCACHVISGYVSYSICICEAHVSHMYVYLRHMCKLCMSCDKWLCELYV